MKVLGIKRRYEGGYYLVTMVRHRMLDFDTTTVSAGGPDGDGCGEYATTPASDMIEEQVDVLRTTDPIKADNVSRELRLKYGLPTGGEGEAVGK